MTPPSAASAAGTNKKRLSIVLLLTCTYLVAEVIGGLVTHSLALLADAGHMMTDVAGLGLALLAIRFGERPATPERTYGNYRVEILAALVNSTFLIGISIYILIEAYRRFRNPPEIASGPMVLIAIVGLAINVAGVMILRPGAKQSLNLKGAYFEVLSDMLSSLGVIVAGAVIWFTGWRYADPLLSAAIGLSILPRTWLLMRDAVGVLLEGTPSDVNLAALRESLLGLPGVSDVHDLHVWTLTSGVNAMSAHIVKSGEATEAELVPNVCGHVIKTFKIAHCTIQAETDRCGEWESHL